MSAEPVINRLRRLEIDLFDVVHLARREIRPLSPDDLTQARDRYARVLDLIRQHAAIAKAAADLESEL